MLRRVMEEIERGLQRGVIDKGGGVGVFVFYPGDEGGAFGRNCKVAATINDAGQRLFGEVAGAGDDAGAVVLQLGDECRANAGSAAGDEDFLFVEVHGFCVLVDGLAGVFYALQ